VEARSMARSVARSVVLANQVREQTVQDRCKKSSHLQPVLPYSLTGWGLPV
jgi:hypothetical protein